MNYSKRGVSRSNLSCKKQMTVYLNTFEHGAMERLYSIFNNMSDIVSSTQNALSLLQKSRKEIRDLINNEFDFMIEELTNKKMELLESLSSKYRSKCKKLQCQLTFMKLHRNLISEKKKEFEKISVNNLLSENERETNLINLTNSQINKLNESFNQKKIIISSSINIRCIQSIKQCLNVLNNIKIVSFHNKRYFEELYHDILMPLPLNDNIKRKKKKKKKINKKRNKIKIKRRIINIIDDDITSDGQIIRDSDDPDDVDHNKDTKCIKLKLIHSQDSSSSSSISRSSSINKEIHETDTDSSSVIKEKQANQKKTKRNTCIPSYSIPSHSKSKSKSIKKNENEEETKMEEIMYNDELKDMEEEFNGSILSKIRGKYGELCSFSSSLKSFGIGLTNNNKVAHKNHGNFNEDYVLLDTEHVISSGVKCFRFHHNTYNYALWGIVLANTENKYDIKHVWGCCTENSYIKNGDYIDNKIQTDQWCGKLVDMMLDLDNSQLKFCSPNFIEPKLNKTKKDNQKLNQTIILNGIDSNKNWCPILKMKHKDTFVMVREIPIQWFGKYPKAVQFDTFTHV